MKQISCFSIIAGCNSCCVDELAAEHVTGDAVIHMGHACLSPTSRLPVFYVLPKASLDLHHFFTAFSSYSSQATGSILLLYDVAYSHLLSEQSRKNYSTNRDDYFQIVCFQFKFLILFLRWLAFFALNLYPSPLVNGLSEELILIDRISIRTDPAVVKPTDKK